MCYGLGLRASEGCILRLGDLNTDRSLLVVRGGKLGKHRLVPYGPRMAGLTGEQSARRTRAGVMDAGCWRPDFDSQTGPLGGAPRPRSNVAGRPARQRSSLA